MWIAPQKNGLAVLPALFRYGPNLSAAGDRFAVASTPTGRIALALSEELSVPEVYGVYSALRADVLVSPAGAWQGFTLLQIDPKLYNTPYPPESPYAPYSAAKMGQL